MVTGKDVSWEGNCAKYGLTLFAGIGSKGYLESSKP